MAKYDVTYSCGHSDTVQLYGPGRDRERKIEWMEESGLCPECYKAKMRAQRDAAHKEAGEKAASYLSTRPELPALVGSEKQIAWANTIRAGIFADAEKHGEALTKAPQPGGGGDLVRKLYPIWYAELCGQSSAKWWIDHRQQSHDEIMDGAYRNPLAMVSHVLTGDAPKTTALSLWTAWIAKDTEVIAYRAKMQAERERRQVEYEAAKEAHIKVVLSYLDRLYWEKAIADDNEIVSTDGHKIEVSQVNTAWIEVRTIDGQSQIDFDGKFACWIGHRPEVQALNKRLTEIWIETIKTPLTTFRVGDRPDSITKHPAADAEWPAINVKSHDGRTAVVVTYNDGWYMTECAGKSVPDAVRKSNQHARIMDEVRAQYQGRA